MSAYTPSNSAKACPTEGGSGTTYSWEAQATPLPPTPNEQLCSCMYDSLSCVPAPGTSTDDYGTLFNVVCGYGTSICAGIEHNGTTGDYGAYGMCNSTQQLGFAFNNYYKQESSAASACSFGGSATIKSATTGIAACSSLTAQAGTAGTGTVTSAPSGTAAVAAGSGSAASGSSASTSKSMGISNNQHMENSLLPMAFIIAVGAVSGLGMIFL